MNVATPKAWIMALLLAVAGAASAGCSESPAEVYGRAKKALEDKDFEAFTATLTERSAKLLRRLRAADKQSRGRYRYMKDLLRVVPTKGKILEVFEEGNLVQLLIGKSERKAERVMLLRELDGWRIDVFESPRFWEPLTFRSAQRRD